MPRSGMACTPAALTDLYRARELQQEMDRAALLVESSRALRNAYVLRAWVAGASDGDAAKVLGITRQAVSQMRLEFVRGGTGNQSEGQR